MTRERILIAFAILVAAILFLPLRLAIGLLGLDALDLTARSASGTVWGGRLHQTRAGPFDLGTLDVSLRPLPLFIGRASLALGRSEGDTAAPLAGIVTVGPGRRAVDGLTGTVTGGTIGALPLESLTFDDASAAFIDGACRDAGGRVSATVGLSIAGLQLRNGMTGTLSCQGRDLAATMTGQSGLERLVLTVDARGNYVARLIVQTADPLLGAGLSAAGFGPTAGGFVRTARGRF